MTHIAIKFVYIQFDDDNWTRTAGPQIRYTAKNNEAGLWVVWFDRSWSYHFTLKKNDQVLVSFQDSIAFIPAKYDKRGDGTAPGDSFP
jgi:agmatine/peptidylarginine deiminase